MDRAKNKLILGTKYIAIDRIGAKKCQDLQRILKESQGNMH